MSMAGAVAGMQPARCFSFCCNLLQRIEYPWRKAQQ